MVTSLKNTTDSQSYIPEKHDPLIQDLIVKIIAEEDGSDRQRYFFNELLRYFYLHPKLPDIYVKKCDLQDIDYKDAYNRATSELTGVALNRKGLTKNKSKKAFTRTNSKTLKKFESLNILWKPLIILLLLQEINCMAGILFMYNFLRGDPEYLRRRFAGFFKLTLNRKIKDVIRESSKIQQENISIDIDKNSDGEETKIELPDQTISGELKLTGLENLINKEILEKNKKIDLLIRKKIVELSSKIHPDGYPQCSCDKLFKKRVMAETKEKWKNIAEQFNVPYGTVTSHYNRKCKPILEQLEKEFAELYKNDFLQ